MSVIYTWLKVLPGDMYSPKIMNVEDVLGYHAVIFLLLI